MHCFLCLKSKEITIQIYIYIKLIKTDKLKHFSITDKLKHFSITDKLKHFSITAEYLKMFWNISIVSYLLFVFIYRAQTIIVHTQIRVSWPIHLHIDVFVCFLNWVERPYQHPPGHIRVKPACHRVYDNHFMVLSHWNITPQAQLYDIPPGHIILVTGQPVFVLNCQAFTMELQLPIFKSFVWLGWESNPGPPSLRA